VTAAMVDLVETRQMARHGDKLDQDKINELAVRFADLGRRLRPQETLEDLALVDAAGRSNGKVAPRWLCHLLMLRHRAVHVLLTTELGSRRCAVLQLRSPTKSEFPLRFDLSAAGHVRSEQIGDIRGAAYAELLEELGLHRDDLEADLRIAASYYDENTDPADYLYNAEFKDLYLGRIEHRRLSERLVLDPDEVAGVAFIPKENLAAFLLDGPAVADALRSSGRRYTGLA
jgi:isopentenyldiphosphate isomerase